MPHSFRQLVLRVACVSLLHTVLLSFVPTPSCLVFAEDDVGRFPLRTEAPAPSSDSAVQPVITPEPPSSPLAPVAPPSLSKPLDTGAVYGWPASEADSTWSQPTSRHLSAIGHFISGDFPRRNDPDDPRRHIGLGEPLHGTSWLNRPHYSALLVGSMIADDLRNNAELHNDLFFGAYHGWDFDHFYGTECRLAGGSYDVFDSPTNDSAGITFADAHLLHYPWGDSRWRPYYSLGFGIAYHYVRDNANRVHNKTLVHFPLGVGLKYQWKYHCAMRFDIKHNINFGGGGLDAMDHVSLSYGFEYRFGGRPKSYFPWNPSVHID